MAAYTFAPAVVLIEATGELAIGATGVLRATEGGDPVQVYDLNDSPLASILVGPKGAHQAFKADIPDGVLDFGSVQLPTESLEQRRSALDALDTANSALFAANEAQTTAQAVSASSVKFWQPSEFVTTGTIRMSPTGVVIQRLADGTTGTSYDATEAAAWTTGTGAAAAYTKRVITSNYTLQIGDELDRELHVTAAGAITITLPSDTVAIPQEDPIPWRQFGAGQITFAAGAGATLLTRGGTTTKSAGQYAEGLVTKVGASTWLLSGDVA